jgi:hypothetical protein
MAEPLLSCAMTSDPAFSEVQHFHQVWVIILVGFIAVLSWAFFIRLLISPADESSAAIIVFVFFIFGIVFPVWFLIMRLEIEVRDLFISYRLFPLHIAWREVPAREIASAEAVTYRPIIEYGGWGMRIGRRGRAYNVSGNRGVFICQKTGKCFLLGSQRPDELATVIERAMEEARRSDRT